MPAVSGVRTYESIIPELRFRHQVATTSAPTASGLLICEHTPTAGCNRMAMIAGGIHESSDYWGGSVGVAEFLTSVRAKSRRKGQRRRHSAETLQDARFRRAQRPPRSHRSSVAGVLTAIKRSSSRFGSIGSSTKRVPSDVDRKQFKSSGSSGSSRAAHSTANSVVGTKGQPTAHVPFSGAGSATDGQMQGIETSISVKPGGSTEAMRSQYNSSGNGVSVTNNELHPARSRLVAPQFMD